MRSPHLLLCAALVLPACKKDEVAPAAAPAPVAEKKAATVTFTTEDEALAGAYDGAKALAFHADTNTLIFIPRGCPSFSCADVLAIGSLDYEKLKKDCAASQFLILETKGRAAAGKSALDSMVHNVIAKGSAYGLTMDATNELELSNAAGPIAGRVNLASGEKVEGTFSAALCPAK